MVEERKEEEAPQQETFSWTVVLLWLGAVFMLLLIAFLAYYEPKTFFLKYKPLNYAKKACKLLTMGKYCHKMPVRRFQAEVMRKVFAICGLMFCIVTRQMLHARSRKFRPEPKKGKNSNQPYVQKPLEFEVIPPGGDKKTKKKKN